MEDPPFEQAMWPKVNMHPPRKKNTGSKTSINAEPVLSSLQGLGPLDLICGQTPTLLDLFAHPPTSFT